MQQKNISILPSRAAISILLLFAVALNVAAQGRKMPKGNPNDSIALFKGMAVSVDLVGPFMLQAGDNGQYEAALKINLKNKYFPTFELGYGKADHRDDLTNIHYKTSAPYFRIGCDFNLLKNKRSSNRLFAGFRYAYTSYKNNVSLAEFKDPVWQYPVKWEAYDNSCYYHWLEFVFGVDAKVWGPLHLGWTGRYRKRIAFDDGIIGNSWYVPGFGKAGNARLGGTFNVIIDI